MNNAPTHITITYVDTLLPISLCKSNAQDVTLLAM